ncbi:SulP family inorganic anion transporter [Xanthobacter oligotrophicus]|uniref:SulP family inorganic anion transporter n=1 Tax=Xanthobacter oligotrophicus TaxID=2607286 RepID=UPI0011F337DB|nr:SulP family inorganic anion transporter [Xanthobacter oligotrophicus]MCG5237212.1 SulP family inorganic anion transporter [Xanthobacter oligotrophicus]
MTDAAKAIPAPKAAGGVARTLGIVRADLVAGLTVAALSLPQSMAYALVAGVDPRFGLYTAIVFTAVAAIFGSSRHLINGPTGAVSLVVFSALAIFDPQAQLDSFEAMFLLAIMIGAIQILIAVTRLGDLTRYISESVVTGFIIGAATLTIIGQVANALGIKAQGTGHQHVLERLYLTLTQDAPWNWKAVTVSVGAVILAIASRKLVRRYRLPQLDMLFVFIFGAGAAYLAGWSTAAPGAKPAIALIEAIPSSLPSLHVPEVKASWAIDLSASAAAIAILGLLEALAIAKAIAHKSGQKLDYNRQILAEGIGNLAGGFFRCMPGAGSLSRTAINYQAGAATRFSGLVTAGFVAITVLAFAPLASYVPKALLSGLLMVAAARLFDFERLRYILRGSRYDAALLVATAFAAIAINIEFAILIGAAISIAWYVTRASRLKAAELVVTPERVVRARVATDPPAQGVLIYDFEGELFFGAAPDLERFLEQATHDADRQGIRYIVLRLKRVRNPDVVGLEVLDIFLKDAQERGLTVLLAGVRPDLLAALERIGIADRLPADRIFLEESEDFSATLKAIRRAYALAAIDVRSDPARRGLRGDWEDLSSAKLAYYLV